jgi:predicted GNAT family N-acyltransferase
MVENFNLRFQGPMNIDAYDRRQPASQQPASVSDIFKDAMTVREAVFVEEQGVPLAMELDADDARSCHLIVYDLAPDRSKFTPVGTVRIVPFPHDPHPLPGSSWDVDENSECVILTSEPPPFIIDRVTSFHDGMEPYIKLGRLAILKEFRGRKLADLLVNSAIEWAEKHPEYFNLPPSRSYADGKSLEIDAYRTTWNGLICVHAQKYVANAWAKWGFVVDKGMGEWTEAGIPHVGMFKRINISKTATDGIVLNDVELKDAAACTNFRA